MAKFMAILSIIVIVNFLAPQIVAGYEILDEIEEGGETIQSVDSMPVDTLEVRKPVIKSSKKQVIKASVIAFCDTLCNKLESIKKTAEILHTTLLAAYTTFTSIDAYKNTNQFEEINQKLLKIMSRVEDFSNSIPKIKIYVKRIRTKIKIAKTVEELFQIDDDISKLMENINKYSESFNLTPEVQKALGTAAPTVVLIKKQFTTYNGYIEKLSDRLNEYIEAYAE